MDYSDEAARWENECSRLQAEIEQLREENKKMRIMLKALSGKDYERES